MENKQIKICLFSIYIPKVVFIILEHHCSRFLTKRKFLCCAIIDNFDSFNFINFVSWISFYHSYFFASRLFPLSKAGSLYSLNAEVSNVSRNYGLPSVSLQKLIS